MNKVTLLQHPQFGDVRLVIMKNEPWFVAKDICDVINIADTYNAIKSLDEDERGTYKVRTLGGEQDMIIISEAGLYTLLLRSNKPQAKPFRRWVTHEVLPSLRKYGSYTTNPQAMQQLQAKANKQATKQLFTEVKKHITTTDLTAIRKHSQCTDWYIQEVLNGTMQDVTIAAALYQRAVGNKKIKPLFYTFDGVQELLQLLQIK